MIRAKDAIRAGRALIGTPYSELDCINFIKKIIRTAPGGVPGYTTAGTNTLWRSAEAAARYRDLTMRQAGLDGAQAGMIAFKAEGEDYHHVGLVTESGTVLHSSSAQGKVIETPLNKSWHALAVHRHIAPSALGGTDKKEEAPMYKAEVNLESEKSFLNLRNGPATGDRVIGRIPHGAVVDVLTEANDWLCVRYEGKSGYAAAEYLMRVGEDEEDDTQDNAEDLPAFTTLMKADGTMIRLEGSWRVAED